MPEIVSHTLQTQTSQDTLQQQLQLLRDYEDDIVKFATGLEKAKIKTSIVIYPSSLQKRAKKSKSLKLQHMRAIENILDV